MINLFPSLYPTRPLHEYEAISLNSRTHRNPQKHAFALLEVLMSIMLLSMALMYLLPPLRNAGQTLSQEKAAIEAQMIAEDAIHNLYANLLQPNTLTNDMLQSTLQPTTIGNYSLSYEISDISPKKQSKSGCYSMHISLLVRPKTDEEAKLTSTQVRRSCDICICIPK